MISFIKGFSRVNVLFLFSAVVIGIFVFFIFPVFAGTLSCVVTSTCASSSGSVIVLQMASTTNSHSEVPNGTSNYTNLVCCSGVPGLSNSCSGYNATTVLYLSNTTNAHVEENTTTHYYSNQACLSFAAPGSGGNISVGYQTASCTTGFDTALISLASTTNSHAAVSSTYPLQVCAKTTLPNYYPVVSAVSISPNPITLTGYPTTPVSVNAAITDYNGCTDITGGTTTIMLYREGVTSSSCLTGSGNGVSTNLNCYTASAFTASSSCVNSSINTTTTFGVYYFAQATDASSSYPSDTWNGTVIFKGLGNATGSADSNVSTSLQTVLAMTITTSSLNYGSIAAGYNTTSTNQTTGVNNAGNCTTTIQVAGQTLLASSGVSLAVSPQRWNTSAFIFPGASTALTASSSPVTLVVLTAPTSTASSSYTQTTYWGLQVSSGTPMATYNGSNVFSTVWHS